MGARKAGPRRRPWVATATNWERARQLFKMDQIVNLVVTSCNRGGLLVEGEDLAGFVPFSHLVEISGQTDAVDRGRLMEAYVGRTLRLKVIECSPETDALSSPKGLRRRSRVDGQNCSNRFASESEPSAKSRTSRTSGYSWILEAWKG